MKLRERLISNATYLVLDWVLAAFLAYIFWSLLGKTITKEQLGIVSTSINFIILVSWLAGIGISTALTKIVPEIVKKKGVKSLSPIVRLSIKPLAISLVSILSIIIFTSSYISNFLNLPLNVIFVCTPSILCISLFSFFGSILYGLQKMKKYFLTNFFQILIRVLLVVPLIFVGLSYFGPLIAFCIGYLTLTFFRIDFNYFKSSNKFFTYKKLFSYAFPALITSLATSLISNSPYIILNSIKNAAITGIFTIAFVISSPIAVLINVLTSALFPTISELSADHTTKHRQSYLIGLLVRYSMLIVIPLSILLIVFSKHVVLIFSSVEYLESALYFPILIPAAILFGIGGIFNSNLYAIGKPKLQRNITIITALFFLLTSIFLTSFFPKAGGMAFAYLATMFLFFTLNLWYIRKFLKINFFTNDIFKIFFSNFLITLVLLFVCNLASSILMVALVSIVYSIAYLLILWLFKFYRMEDIKVIEFFGKRFPLIGKYFFILTNFLRKKL